MDKSWGVLGLTPFSRWRRVLEEWKIDKRQCRPVTEKVEASIRRERRMDVIGMCVCMCSVVGLGVLSGVSVPNGSVRAAWTSSVGRIKCWK